MRMDRGFRQPVAVLAALVVAAAAPVSAARAAVPAEPLPEPGPAVAYAIPDLVAFPPALREDDPQPAQPEPVTEAGRAAALAEPAIVLIDVRWEGYVRDRETGDLLDPDLVSASTQCTGAGVGHEGYLLTTRSCLDQSAVAAEAFRQIVQRRVADGSVTAAAADDLLADLLTRAWIGDDPDAADPPERSVSVRRAVTDGEPMPAFVVATADPADGDAALLKISRSNQPVLPLAGDSDLALGTELVTIQCVAEADESAPTAPGDGDGDDGAQPLRPRFYTGTVAEISPRVLVAPSEPENPIGPAGGVVLTHDAAIAGLVDTSLATGELLVDLAAIRDLLAEAEVDTEPGQVDRDYRAGLDAYYEGRYGDAIARFDSVLAIIPSHLQAHQYRTSAQILRDDQDDPPPPADEVVDTVEGWLGGRSWSLVGILVLVAIVVFLAQRRRPDAALPAAGPGGATEPPGHAAAVAATKAAEVTAGEVATTEVAASETPHEAGRS